MMQTKESNKESIQDADKKRITGLETFLSKEQEKSENPEKIIQDQKRMTHLMVQHHSYINAANVNIYQA